MSAVDVGTVPAKVGLIAAERKAAIRRRAMKRWLRARDIQYSTHEMYNETALRKKIRAALDRAQGGAV